jgi:hypothetical protein
MLFSPTSADVHIGMIIYMAGLVLIPSRRAAAFSVGTVAIYAAVSACSDALASGNIVLFPQKVAAPLLWPALSFGVAKFRKARWCNRFVWSDGASASLEFHAARPPMIRTN